MAESGRHLAKRAGDAPGTASAARRLATRSCTFVFVIALLAVDYGEREVRLRPDAAARAGALEQHGSPHSLDHAGFQSRARRGARAENVAFGYSTEAATIAQWWRSPRH